MITSPSLKDSSSSLSASQSYSAWQRRRPTMLVLPPRGEPIASVAGTVVDIIVGWGCCRGQKKYGCSGVSRWKSTENKQGNKHKCDRIVLEYLLPILGCEFQQFFKLFNNFQ
jgi:hypothetical protein